MDDPLNDGKKSDLEDDEEYQQYHDVKGRSVGLSDLEDDEEYDSDKFRNSDEFDENPEEPKEDC